ncbi:MAG: FAD-binding oxidoreductase, partial [Myxococcota bacterium]
MGSYETPSWASGSWSAERPETIEACVQMLADVRHDGGRVWPMGGGRHSRRPPANDVTVLDTRGMDAIRRLDREALVVTVEAGVTVGALAAYVARRGASVCGWRREHPEATVGGLLSAWQPVPHALWNGSVREACLGLGAVTGAGDRYRYLPAPRKASGPDLRFVFIGAEGVYGVVTTATLAVSPPPAARVAWEATDLEPTQALELASRCARTGLRAANVLYSGQTRTMRW